MATLGIAALTGSSAASTSAAFTDQAQARTSISTTEAACSTWTSGSSNRVIPAATYHTGHNGYWTTGAAVCSPDSRWEAVFQGDGNFVLYDMDKTPGLALWNSWTFGSHLAGKATSMVLTPAGNLELRNVNGSVLKSTGLSGVATPVTVSLTNTPALELRDRNGALKWSSAGGQSLDCNNFAHLVCNPYTVDTNPGGNPADK